MPDKNCSHCDRLKSYRNKYRKLEPTWYNSPVESFGAIDSKILIVGLAPGLQGANKTGRPFTGDHAGNTLYPTLINILDHFYDEYRRKPSAVTTYSVSPFGGVRVSNPLRSFLSQLGMPPINAMLHAPFVGKHFNEDGDRTEGDIKERKKEFDFFANEIEWYANALKEARNKS